MTNGIFTYIRPDGYIERITSENCVLTLNSPPAHRGDLPTKMYQAEQIKRFSIWDEYDNLGNLSDVRLDERRCVCNYHVFGMPKHKRVFKGKWQVTETSDSFENLRTYFLKERNCIELPCSESDSLILIVSHARDQIPVPREQRIIDDIFNQVVERLL